jgi:hypothetical protein
MKVSQWIHRPSFPTVWYWNRNDEAPHHGDERSAVCSPESAAETQVSVGKETLSSRLILYVVPIQLLSITTEGENAEQY